ncbi:MAG: phosphoglucosamine mutase [Planctomycetaceae bacterium]|nr:phosphoglucosamine mutase [Planctomycetaceae bacterium]
MSELIISVSGLRGIIGETLTPEVAIRYTTAFSAEAKPGPFVITRDGRPTGAMLAQAIHAGLNAVGRNTVDAGVAATPTTGVLIRELGAAGGIQISASHNPSEYNGIKLFSAEGRVIPKTPGTAVLERYRQGQIRWVPHNRVGKRTECEQVIESHLKKVLATVDVEAIRKRKFKVLLDSNRGAGSLLGTALLKELGCEVVLLGGEPDGLFEHIPEPTAENLQPVFEKVKNAKVDVGFCQDPDADRLAVIDQNGRYIGEEYTVAHCVEHVLRRRTKGPIVINCSSSRMTQDIAERYGVPLFQSPVGEANVVDLMLEKGAIFGGEGNGGPIDPEVGLVRDSFVGMAQILDAMCLRKKTVAELADELPRYEIVKQKITLPSGTTPDQIRTMMDALAKKFTDQKCDRRDGLRIDWPQAWVLIRGSNTEPILRVIAEAKTEAEAVALCEKVRANLEIS